METQQLVDKDEGKLINIKWKWSHYLAPSKKGIAKFNLKGDIIEMGLDHNTTVKMQIPIRFALTGCEDFIIYKQKSKGSRLKCGTIVINKKLKTSIGKLFVVFYIDVNDNGEIVVSLKLNLPKGKVKTKKTKIKINNTKVNIVFDLFGDYVEQINSKEQVFASLADENNQFIITGIDNISNIDIEKNPEFCKCLITAEKIINKKCFIVAKFKLGMKKSN